MFQVSSSSSSSSSSVLDSNKQQHSHLNSNQPKKEELKEEIKINEDELSTFGEFGGTNANGTINRPIYPNVPYSPYSSPGIIRRSAPLKECRTVSIDSCGPHQQLNQYKLIDSIGQGSYGFVKLALNQQDGRYYAMKILSKKRLLRRAGCFEKRGLSLVEQMDIFDKAKVTIEKAPGSAGRKIIEKLVAVVEKTPSYFLMTKVADIHRGKMSRVGPNGKGSNPLDKVYREIAVLKKLNHPNVVKLVEVLDDPTEDNLYMVFELLERGEVIKIPTDKPLSEQDAWKYFRDIILGLEYLHFQKIIHRDLKPSNLLLGDDDHVQIADLGLCNEFQGSDARLNSTAGSPAFTPPETLQSNQRPYSGKAVDIWSLGCTLYSFVFGRLPYYSDSILELYNMIKTQPVVFPDEPIISSTLRDMLLRMLEKNPEDRITLPQIKEHEWITKGGKENLPSESENCDLVQVTEEEVDMVVKSIPKLNTLILIKTMLRKHSFQNPFSNSNNSRKLEQTDRSYSAPESTN